MPNWLAIVLVPLEGWPSSSGSFTRALARIASGPPKVLVPGPSGDVDRHAGSTARRGGGDVPLTRARRYRFWPCG